MLDEQLSRFALAPFHRSIFVEKAKIYQEFWFSVCFQAGFLNLCLFEGRASQYCVKTREVVRLQSIVVKTSPFKLALFEAP
jgi:hypothetical protein